MAGSAFAWPWAIWAGVALALAICELSGPPPNMEPIEQADSPIASPAIAATRAQIAAVAIPTVVIYAFPLGALRRGRDAPVCCPDTRRAPGVI